MKKAIIGIVLLASLNNYISYKNDLIQRYSIETYNLMNQEAGIDNEIESYIHYVMYGK